MRDRFRKWHFALLIKAHEIVVHFDMFQQICIGSWRSDGDVSSWSQRISACIHEEIGSRMPLEDQIVRLDFGRKRHSGMNGRNIRLDMECPFCRATDTR